MSISTHVLDTARGRPAAGLAVSLARLHNADWILVHQGRTDDNGRVQSLFVPSPACEAEPATYRLRFETKAYFAAHRQPSLYPYIDIVFEAETSAHYHIPLLLAAHGYTTYRGS